MSGMPQIDKRARQVFEKVNWKRVRRQVLSKSVRIPAPVFFLIFFAISWACFTLYFKAERNTRAIEQLVQRQAAVEAHLNELTNPDPQDPPPEEDELDLPESQILEM